MLGLPLDFWRHLRIALPSEAWREFLDQVRQWHGCGGIIGCVDEARFAIGAAVYWLAYDYGQSEFDQLRCAATIADYKPSPRHCKVEDAEDELAVSLYQTVAPHL